MARKHSLEIVTKHYWDVSHVLRCPNTEKMFTAEQAFRKLNKSDYLHPDTDWRLVDLMHVLKYDIIEGNTQWRGNPQETDSALILHMKDWISTPQPKVEATQKAMQ